MNKAKKLYDHIATVKCLDGKTNFNYMLFTLRNSTTEGFYGVVAVYNDAGVRLFSKRVTVSYPDRIAALKAAEQRVLEERENCLND